MHIYLFIECMKKCMNKLMVTTNKAKCTEAGNGLLRICAIVGDAVGEARTN